MNKEEFRCRSCVLPITRPGITIHEDGICEPCKTHERRQEVDWKKRWNEFKNLFEPNEKVILPLSGGKDSYAQAYYLSEELELDVIGFMIDNSSWTKTGRENFYNLSRKFDIPIYTYTPRLDNLRFCVLSDFVTSLHPMKFWDELLYTKPLEFADSMNIRHVIWGENTDDFNGGKNFTRQNPDYKCKTLYLSDYINWSRYDNLEIAKSFGFKDLLDTQEWKREGLEQFPFEQVDTIGYLVNQYCKFIKFGFSNQTELCSDAVRHGKMTRDIALRQVHDFDWKLDPRMLSDFCSFIGITENEFWMIIDDKVNKNLLEKRDGWWKLKSLAK